MPGHAVLLSPLLDLTLQSHTIDTYEGVDPQTPRWLLEQMCNAYVSAGPAARVAASPLHADLHGLPPILVQTAELEGLRGDAEAFHRAGRRAGVASTLQIWPGMIHVWQAFAPRLPEAGAALAAVGEWLDATRGEP